MTGIIGLPPTVGSSVSGSAYTFTGFASTLNTRDFHCLAGTIPLSLECSGKQDIEPNNFKHSTDAV